MAWGGKTGEGANTSGKSGTLSFIGSEVTISGNIFGNGDIHLDGAVEGDIHCASLILGLASRIKGNITAERATLAGMVSGTVNAGTLIVEKSARISGDLSYENVSIEPGAQVDGRLTQRGSNEAQLKLVAGGE